MDSRYDRALHVVGILYAALVSLVFILMLISLPLGPYIVFHLDVGDGLSSEFPFRGLDLLLAEAEFGSPSGLELGDLFIVMWSVYVILLAVSMLGPKKSLIKFILPAVMEGRMSSGGSYAASVIKWFSIVVVVSVAITFVQDGFGIATEPPETGDDLLQFVNVTSSPILEELGFRVLLVGLPLYLAYSHRMSAVHFLRSLWRPGTNLHPDDYKRAIWLVVGTSVLFGLAHILLEEPWTTGKFAQAAASGMIIGWVYLRYGLLPAILIHWATNYFIFTYAYFVAHAAELSVEQAFAHPLMGSLEILFLATGAFSLLVIVTTWHRSRSGRMATDLSVP